MRHVFTEIENKMECDKTPKEKKDQKNQNASERKLQFSLIRAELIREAPQVGGAGDREERPEVRTALMERVSTGAHSKDNRDVNSQGQDQSIPSQNSGAQVNARNSKTRSGWGRSCSKGTWENWLQGQVSEAPGSKQNKVTLDLETLGNSRRLFKQEPKPVWLSG